MCNELNCNQELHNYNDKMLKYKNEYINYQTGEKLDLERVNNLIENAMLKVKPETWIIWDFEKNDELGFDIWKMTYRTRTEVWWYCGFCKNSYFKSISRLIGQKHTLYCPLNKVNHYDSLAYKNLQLINEWHLTKNVNTLYDFSYSSDKIVWWTCNKCGSSYDIKICAKTNGKGCPYCSGKRVNHTNSLASLRPDLIESWHSTKNGELTPHDVTPFREIKVWWICSKCNSEYEAKIVHRVNHEKCSYCNGRNVNHTNSLATLNPQLAKQWHPTKNGNLTPYDVKAKENNKAWWLGECGHEWQTTINSRNNGCGCPYCANQKVLKGFNDFATKRPNLAKFLVNEEDGYKYTFKSKQKVDWICPKCGEIIKDREIQEVTNKGLCCKVCGDGISYPEKFMRALLKYLNIKFIYNKKQNWSDGRKYDFFIKELNIIIETHGGQHFKEGFEFLNGRSLEEEQINDQYKYEMAIQNGIPPENYIVIDCRKSDFDFIKNNIINSRLSEIFDLSNVDWEELNIVEKSIVVEAWELWDSGIHSTSEIGKLLGIAGGTIKNYLKRGASLGKCTYTTDTRVKYIQRAVVKLDIYGSLIQTYDSLKIAGIENEIKSPSQIGLVCRGIGQTIKGYRWMYLDDYEQFLKSNAKKLPIVKNKMRKIIQLDLDGNFIKEWNSIKEASIELNIDSNGIISVCKRRSNASGGFRWVYLEDYEKFLKGEIVLRNKNKNRRIRKIVQLTLNGELVKQYDSMKDACDALNISSGSLSDACRRVKKTTKGFKWMYLEDYKELKKTIK